MSDTANLVRVAKGRTAEIFDWEPGTILKLYRDWCPGNWADYESRVARTIHAAGIQTPAVKGIVEINGRRGIVYERVSGISMLQDLSKRPWMLFKHGRNLAELQAQFVQLKIEGLGSYRNELEHVIRNTGFLPEDLRALALSLLETLPEGETLCHGDFHPANVLITPQGPVIIDWMTAKRGSPWADVARTRLLLTIGPKGAGKGDGNQISPWILWFVNFFYRAYFKRVQSLLKDDLGEQERWLPVVAAARLEEQIEPERAALLDLVRSSLIRR